MRALTNQNRTIAGKGAAFLFVAIIATTLLNGGAMSASRERIQFICNTSGIANPDVFCSAVAESLAKATGAAVSLVKAGALAGDGLAARLEFSVKGQSGQAQIEIGTVTSGQFIVKSSEVTGTRTMDAPVETGVVQLLANLLATGLRQQ
jgi:hypothetical protein